MNEEIKLTIVGLVYNQTVIGTYGLVLNEISGTRRFSVMIGEPEAQSIALKLNNKKPPRPLTHDLIQNILELFDAKLEKVVIYNMINDVFYSELFLRKEDNLIVVDARTSDAVALAVRMDASIFIRSEILDKVGTSIEPQTSKKENEEVSVNADELTASELDQLSLFDLEELLKMSVSEEKYELAVRIRDAIQRKEKK